MGEWGSTLILRTFRKDDHFETTKENTIMSNLTLTDTTIKLGELNISVEELKVITLEIHDNLDKITKLAEDDGLLDKTVELVNPQIRLMWNMARNTWGGVKLVASDLKVIGD